MSSSLAESLPTSPAAPVENWWQIVRRATFRQVTLESALSWPVPLRLEAGLALAAFYYGVWRPAGFNSLPAQARPPRARLVAAYPSGRLWQFTHHSLGELFPGLPTQVDLGPLLPMLQSPASRAAARANLFTTYNDILAPYLTGEVPGRERGAFLMAWQSLAEPGLLPYYHALNPDFFDWLARP